MNMTWIDWSIVAGLFAVMLIAALGTKKYVASVADFLAASRCAGRYLLAVSDGMAGLAAMNFVMYFEIIYDAGFPVMWWEIMALPASIIIVISGWVIYRFRQTRAFTIAQFYEIRYSRRFRVFAGALSSVAGILNFAIFPSVGARFFIYFCGFPETITFMGVNISVFALVMLVLLSIALFFTFIGGQIAVMVTDFIQGLFSNIMFIILLIAAFSFFKWSQISEAMAMVPEDASLINPFHTSKIENFNFAFYAIGIFFHFYRYMSHQGLSGYNCSAKSPHEAKMGRIVGLCRTWIQFLLLYMLPICAFTLMHHPDFTDKAEIVRNTLEQIGNPTLRKQVTVSAAVSQYLPVGLLGGLCAVVFAAFISTHDTYLHSWGSIVVQDVIMPFRKSPLRPKQHIKYLRLSIIGVAVFIFFFSFFFKHTQHIVMYLSLSGALYMGGAGSVTIGGLYWKKGTTAGAWGALITGSIIGFTGLLIKQVIYPEFFLNGQWIAFIAAVSSAAMYIIVSFLTSQSDFNMDKMLHRGKYAVEDKSDLKPKSVLGDSGMSKIFKKLGITKEFTRGDKLIYFLMLSWMLGWFSVFIIGTVYNLMFEVSNKSWMDFWKVKVFITFGVGVSVTVWILIGGLRDIKDLFKRLKTIKRNDLDDGTVVDHHNLGE